MSGKITQLTPLQTRKQLLVIESELNRVQLIQEISHFKGEIHHLQQVVDEIGSLAASVSKLGTLFTAVCQTFTKSSDGESSSWISKLMKGAKAGAALWSALRSSGGKG